MFYPTLHKQGDRKSCPPSLENNLVEFCRPSGKMKLYHDFRRHVRRKSHFSDRKRAGRRPVRCIGLQIPHFWNGIIPKV